jgi:hypothetical protein
MKKLQMPMQQNIHVELTLCINMIISNPMLQNATHLTSIDSRLL